MAQTLCEDVLERVLAHLIQIYKSWPPSHRHVLNSMLVGHAWLEVGRRHLYGGPDLAKSPLEGPSDSVVLFVESLLHHNHRLGTYVRTFNAIDIHLGPVVLSRMIALMHDLQTLIVEDLDFIDHFPKTQSVPSLSVLEARRPDDTVPHDWSHQRRLELLIVDRYKYSWLLSAREVHLRNFHIRAQSSETSSAWQSNLHKLVLARCTWDPSALADLVPQLASRLVELQINDFGLTYRKEQNWRTTFTWGETSHGPSKWAGCCAGDVLLPSLYGLARHVDHLTLRYASGCFMSGGPDLSLLCRKLETCEVDLQDSAKGYFQMHKYPPNTARLHIKVNELHESLLYFIGQFQEPDDLPGLEAYPEIWIKTATTEGDTTGTASASAVPDTQKWVQARQAAIESLALRGLDPTHSPSQLVVPQPLATRWSDMHITYTSFWSCSFVALTHSGWGNAANAFVEGHWG